MQQSYAWQQATAANNVVQMETPHAPKGHASHFAAPIQSVAPAKARMQGLPDKRLKKKMKPLRKYDEGTSTKAPENWFSHPPKGYKAPAAKEYPKSKGKIPGYRTVARPTQADERAKRAQAAAMAVHDGLDASMPMDQRKMLYGNAKPSAPVGFLFHKHKGL